MARIAILTSPEGHASIAEAISQALQSQHHVESITIRDSLFKLYTPIYQFFPNAFQVPYKLSQQATFLAGFRKVMQRKLTPAVVRFLDKTKPDIVVCTHYFFLYALEPICKSRNIKLINIIPDPWSIHPMTISKSADANVVFDEKTLELCRAIEPEAHYEAFGWFVRQEFSQQSAESLKDLREKLKLNPKLPTILVAGGSEGTMMIMKLLPALLQLKKPVQAIVLCGSNVHLHRSVRMLSLVLRNVTQSRIIPVGFTADVAEYVAVADLVVGKAGPNTIFEAVAAGKPFFAITHITGQEDGNLELIKHYHIGQVEEHPLKAVKTLRAMLLQPKKLTQYSAGLELLAAYNRQAKTKLINLCASYAG